MRMICAVILLSVFPFGACQINASDNDATSTQPVQGFEGVVRRSVDLWSDGTRLSGDLTWPVEFSNDKKYPCIVMCPGWGGLKQRANVRISPQFADAGYVVFTFDYRGWGDSDSRLVVTSEIPQPDSDGTVEVTARPYRQVIDPYDQQEDIDAALCFVSGEPMVDVDRIGLWGTSFGGGHVIWRAAHDKRPKCVVAQVGSMDSHTRFSTPEAREKLRQDKTKRARGELTPYPTPAERIQLPGLRGTPFNAKFLNYFPARDAALIDVPTLIIDAELEHYFRNEDNGQKAYSNIKGNAPVEYHKIPRMKHYDIYKDPHLIQVMALEIAWFDRYLK